MKAPTFPMLPILVLAACADAPPPPQFGPALGAGELRAATADKRYRATTPRGRTLVVTYRADGTMELGGASADIGRYRIEGERLCSRWSVLNEGEETCHTVHPTPDGKLLWRNGDGSLDSTAVEAR